jgi:hypothetical protein
LRARANGRDFRRHGKIGVLTDMTGVFSDLAGGGAVTAAQMAIDDFVESERPSFKIEPVSVYHQNKPDIATGIARQWYDTSTSMTDAAAWTVATLTNMMPKPRLGQTRTSSDLDVMSAVLLITDSTRTSFNVADGPGRDSCTAAKCIRHSITSSAQTSDDSEIMGPERPRGS